MRGNSAGVPESHGMGHRFALFLLAGVVNTAVGYGIYALLVLTGMPAQPALLTGYGLGVLWNYFTHARFVFRQGGLARLPAYIAVYLLVLGLNSAGLEGLLRMGLPPLVAQALLVVPAALLSFVLVARVLTGAFPIIGRK